MRFRALLLLGFCGACSGRGLTAGEASRREFQAALERELPRGTPVAAAEARLRAGGFACRAEEYPSPDSPDTLHALVCEKPALDSVAGWPWVAAVYHDRARVDTVDAIAGGGPR